MGAQSKFLTEYIYYGSYREKVQKLTSEIDKNGCTIFNTTIELYITAAVVGLIFNQMAEPEKGGDTTKIFSDQFSNHFDDVKFVFLLVLLNHNKNINKSSTAISQTFCNYETDDNFRIFEKYMLGGINVLYDTFFVSSNLHYEDYLNTLINFLSKTVDSKKEVASEEIDFENLSV